MSLVGNDFDKNGKENKETYTELEEQLKSETGDVEIPESLKPENIEKMLNEKSGKKSSRKSVYTIAAAAACCMLVIGIVAFGSGMREHSEDKSASANTNSASFAKKGKESGDKSVSSVGKIASAKDYDEVYQYIKAEKKSMEGMYAKNGYARGADESAGLAANRDNAAGLSANESANQNSAKGSPSSYSDTNIRQEGVQEGDIVKTDGKHLFILTGQRIQIVDIQKPEMKPLGTIQMKDGQHISEIYVKNDRLVVVYSTTKYKKNDSKYKEGPLNYTVAETFDVSRPDEPKSVGKITQSGNYSTMRVSGDDVYLFSRFNAQMQAARKDVGAYIPEVQGKVLESSDILLPQYSRGNQYTVVSSFSLKNPGDKIDSKAIFGSEGLVYVSNDNIYVCESYYNSDDSDVTQTCIRKVSYKDGKLKAVGQTKIDGTINDSFSIDEYKGNLRLVTTVSGAADGASPFPLVMIGEENEFGKDKIKDSNSLYILDKDLKELSKLDGLAEDERVYSARFMGDVGYFVTYKQVDPLFSVNLSDPKNPKIIGELKIPGFSDYLHPYGDGLLLGIGMDVDETGTTTNGVKLSMFDVSNPEDVREVNKYVLKDVYSTNVTYNYKAALISAEKNLIGFSAYGAEPHYYIFSYDEKNGFKCIFDHVLTGYSEGRGVYAGDTFYLVAGNTVESFTMDTFKKIDDIVL